MSAEYRKKTWNTLMKPGDLVQETFNNKLGILLQENIVISDSLVRWSVFIDGTVYDLYPWQFKLVENENR